MTKPETKSTTRYSLSKAYNGYTLFTPKVKFLRLKYYAVKAGIFRAIAVSLKSHVVVAEPGQVAVIKKWVDIFPYNLSFSGYFKKAALNGFTY